MTMYNGSMVPRKKIMRGVDQGSYVNSQPLPSAGVSIPKKIGMGTMIGTQGSGRNESGDWTKKIKSARGGIMKSLSSRF